MLNRLDHVHVHNLHNLLVSFVCMDTSSVPEALQDREERSQQVTNTVREERLRRWRERESDSRRSETANSPGSKAISIYENEEI